VLRDVLAAPRVSVAMPVILEVYAIVAVAWLHHWTSGVAAVVVGLLLWRRHPRARFSMYVLCSATAARAAIVGDWLLLAAAVAAVVAMQTRGAASTWPRLRARATHVDSDRMARP
jgi:hypothetical protein